MHGKAPADLDSEDLSEHRRTRLLRRSAKTLLPVAIVIALVAGVVAIGQRTKADERRREAQEQTRLALARRLAARSDELRAGDPRLSMLLAATAFSYTPAPEARRAMLDAYAQPVVDQIRAYDVTVSGVVSSPDGSRFATIGYDDVDEGMVVILWDAATHEPIRRLPGGVVAFSPDGETMAVGPSLPVASGSSPDGVVTLVDVATGRPAGDPITLEGSFLDELAFVLDGEALLMATDTGDDDGVGTLQVWDVAERARVGEPMVVRRDEVVAPDDYDRLGYDFTGLAVSPDGHTIATTGDSGLARVWDVTSRRQIAEPLYGGGGDVSLAFTPDGMLLVGGSGLSSEAGLDGELAQVDMWDPTSRQSFDPDERLTAAISRPTGLSVSPDGRLLAAVTGTEVQLWDLATGETLGGPVGLGRAGADSVAFSPEGGMLVTGNATDGTIRIWDVDRFRQVTRFVTEDPGVEAAAFSPSGDLVASVRDGAEVDGRLQPGAVDMWDPLTGERVGDALALANHFVIDVAFSPDGRLLAVVSHHDANDLRGSVEVFDVETRTRQQGLLGGPTDNPGTVAFDRTGRLLIIGSGLRPPDGSGVHVQVRDVETGRQVGETIDDGDGPAALSPDGELIAGSDAEGGLGVWRRDDGAEVASVALGAYPQLRDVAFSPDGDLLAASYSTDEGYAVAVLRTSDYEQVEAPLVLDGIEPLALAFRADGEVLAIGDAEGDVWIYDMTTGEPIGQPMKGHTNTVTSVAFSPDGDQLLTGAADDTARVWNVAVPTDPVAAVCAVVVRPLTLEEWRRFLGDEPYHDVCA
jgi:WD40 repeat protein